MGSQAIRTSFESKTLASSRGLRREISSTQLLRILVLASAAVAPYLNTLGNGFVFDDNLQVLENPYIRSFRYIGKIFGTNVWSFLGGYTATKYYRPLMSMQYLLTYQAFGKMAYPYHLLSVLMNAAIVFLLYGVTRRLFGSERIAVLAAAVFALLPAHVEVVAWVAGVPDLQMTLLLLAAFWFYLNLGDPDRRRWWTWPLLAGSFAGALLAKEPAIMFPAVAAVFEHFFRTSPTATSWQTKVRRYAPLWAVSVIYLLSRRVLMGSVAPTLRIHLTWLSTIRSAIALCGQYTFKLIWPSHLSTFYPFSPSASFSDVRFLAGLACVAAFAIASRLLWHRNREFVFGIAWLGLFLAPVLNVRWLGTTVFAERYLYLPSIGFSWLAAGALNAGFDSEFAKRRRWIVAPAAALATVVLVLFGARIILRNRDWHDDVRYFSTAVRENPSDAQLHSDLGAAFWRVSRDAEAVAEWNIALSRDPNNVLALTNLATAALFHKDYEHAETFLARALKIKPTASYAHAELAEVMASTNHPEQAEREYLAAISLSPLDLNTRNRFARFLMSNGRESDGAREFRSSLDVLPNSDAYDGLGDIALRHDDVANALFEFQHAENLDDYDHHAHFQLALLYAAAGNIIEARREYNLGYQTDVGTDPLAPAAKAALEHSSPKR